jgi:hypothetical protein
MYAERDNHSVIFRINQDNDSKHGNQSNHGKQDRPEILRPVKSVRRKAWKSSSKESVFVLRY